MIEPEEISKKLEELYQRLIRQRMLPKGKKWKGDWPGWKYNVTWYPDTNGVYILWQNDHGVAGSQPPIYVGEGILGPRIWESFQIRANWHFAQLIVDDLISGEPRECKFWRKVLERFCILALDPLDNRD